MDEKYCPRCKEAKSVSEFSKSRSRKDGLQSTCKKCCYAYKKSWLEDNKHAVAKNRMWTRYRLRPEDYDAWVRKQDGKCALCNNEFTETPCVDHDHSCCPDHYKTCGKCIRGFLCSTCNKNLGGYEAIVSLGTIEQYLMPR